MASRVDPNFGDIPEQVRETLVRTGDWLRDNTPEDFRFVLFVTKLDGSDAAYTSNLDRASAVDVMRELWEIMIATNPQTAQEREARNLLIHLKAMLKRDAEQVKMLADGEMNAVQADPQMIRAMAQYFAVQHALESR